MDITNNDITDLISCPICIDTLEEPKALPCLHTFCKACIKDHIRSNLETHVEIVYFACPTCRKKVHGPKGKPPSEWADCLPHNHMVATLLSSAKGDNRKKIFCSSHPEKSAEFFCFDHESMLCNKCLLNHRTCTDVDEMDDAVRKTLAKGTELDDRLCKVEAIYNKLQDKKNSLQSKISCTKDQITAWKEQIFEAVSNFEERMQKQLDKEALSALKQLDNEMKGCHFHMQKIKSLQKDMSGQTKSSEDLLKASGNLNELCASVDNHLNSFSLERHIEIAFQTNVSVIEKLSQDTFLGKLVVELPRDLKPQPKVTDSQSGSKPVNGVATLSQLRPDAKPFVYNGKEADSNRSPPTVPQILHPAPRPSHTDIGHIPKRDPKLVNRFNARTEKDRRDCLITGATFLSNGVTALCDHDNAKIKFFDKESNLMTEMGFNSDPWDIAACGPDEVAVSFPDDNMILFFRVINGRIMASRPNIRTEARCYGIAVKNNKMSVTCRDQRCVQVFIIDLYEKTTIGCWSKEKTVSKSGGLWYTSFNEEGSMIYVTDDSVDRIVCLSLTGQVLYQFSHTYVAKPRGIASCGSHIYVACGYEGKSPRLQDGYHHIPNLEVSCVSASVICVDSLSGRLVLANNIGNESDNWCKVYEIQKTFSLT